MRLQGVLNAAPELNSHRLLAARELDEAMHAMSQICDILPAELGSQLFVRLRNENQGLFDQTSGLFGEAVDDAFPDSVADISEAGKCLALQRYTAAVFHMMRAMEGGVAVLADRLGVTVDNIHGERLAWGILVANMKSKIGEIPKGETQDSWLQVHSLLHSANRAYRTKTAHPKKSYNEEEAAAAYHATKSFMQEMAALI